MNTRHAPPFGLRCLLAVVAGLVMLGLAPSASAQDIYSMADQINQLQREVADLQRQVNVGGGASAGSAVGGGNAAAGQEVRLQQMDEQIRTLTGQVEQLSYKGPHYEYENVPIALRPYQKPFPAFWYGSSGAEGSTSEMGGMSIASVVSCVMSSGAIDQRRRRIAPAVAPGVPVDGHATGEASTKELSIGPHPSQLGHVDRRWSVRRPLPRGASCAAGPS